MKEELKENIIGFCSGEDCDCSVLYCDSDSARKYISRVLKSFISTKSPIDLRVKIYQQLEIGSGIQINIGDKQYVIARECGSIKGCIPLEGPTKIIGNCKFSYNKEANEQ